MIDSKHLFTIGHLTGSSIIDIDGIFSIYPDNGYPDFAFFGPKLRNPIMDAGRSQTILKVRYNGSDRLVEPYSLKYQQKKDGREREYFYVYNLSGGSSPPGIRMFVAENMESVENTDQKFTPREGCQIELSKSGKTPENPYLFDPNKPVKRPRAHASFGSRKSRSSFGIKYIYRCATCGKKFTRISMNSRLNQHKGRNGYPCYGGYGIYEGTKC